VKQQYFFGYLFVRSAKGLALLVTLIGIGFCVLQYSQANTAVSAVAYQPSTSLRRALGNLKDAFSATEQIVGAFNADNQIATPKVQPPRFPTIIESNADFAHVNDTLSRIDQDRQLLKQSVVSRFEAPAKSIEAKLRAYAANRESQPSPTPVALANPAPTAKSFPSSAQPKRSLFSSKLGAGEVEKRRTDIALRKEFLKVLGTKAENPENRLNLNEAADQLNALSRLLPEKVETSASAQSSSASSDPQAEQARKVFPSERVAGKLEQIRGEVTEIFLTSWTLDDAFEQASDVRSIESNKCRMATLAQKGIWLSAVSRILIGLLAAALVSFLILVCADLVKTFLDTASHTGVVADAINALRGSVVTTKSQTRSPESVL